MNIIFQKIRQSIFWILAAVVTFSLSTCTEPLSLLSDLEISDPSLINLVIVLTKTIDSSNREYHKYSVKLNDKNNQLIILKAGAVTVNDLELDVDSNGEYTRSTYNHKWLTSFFSSFDLNSNNRRKRCR